MNDYDLVENLSEYVYDFHNLSYDNFVVYYNYIALVLAFAVYIIPL